MYRRNAIRDDRPDLRASRLSAYLLIVLLAVLAFATACDTGSDTESAAGAAPALSSFTILPNDAPDADPPRENFCAFVAASGDGYRETCAGVTVLHVTGTPWEIGYQTGELLRGEITELVHFVRTYIDPWGAIWGALQHLRSNLEPNIRPAFAEEIEGMVAGLNNDITYEELVTGNALGDVFGVVTAFMDNYMDVDFCTLTASWGEATTDGELLVTRNFDYMNLFAKYNYVAIVRPDAGHAFVTTGIMGLSGTHVAMNENGLVGALAYNSSYDSDMTGVPMLLLLREAVQFSDSVEDAIALVGESDRTMGLNYMFADGDTKEAVVFEVSGGKTARRTSLDGLSTLLATNHYVAATMQQERKPFAPEHTSMRRWDRVSHLLKKNYGNLSPFTLQSIIRDHYNADVGDDLPSRTTVCRHDDVKYREGSIMGDFVSTSNATAIMKPIDGLYCTTVTKHACEMPYVCFTPFGN
ncbi:C45 family peptidase [bacterium]|nr:C45 family peptidase [bacterium]